jgi:hypothetical protein
MSAFSNINWNDMSAPASPVNVSAQGSSAWMVSTNGDVYSYDENNYAWSLTTDLFATSTIVQVSAGADGSVVAMASNTQAFIKSYGYWDSVPQLAFGVANVAVGDVDNFILVDTQGSKFKNQYGNVQMLSSALGPTKISTTAGLQHIWGVSATGAVYKWNQTTSSWSSIGGRSLKQINVSLSSSGALQVVGVDAAGNGWAFNPLNNFWSSLTKPSPTDQFIWVEAGRGFIWAATSSGQIYRSSI